VILVDRRGQLLLQLRTSDAHVDAGKWGIPGGKLEPGEDPLAGALRETEEETGLRIEMAFPYGPGYGYFKEGCGGQGTDVEFWTFYAPCGYANEDVQCLEGQAMLFVPASQVPHLEWGQILSTIVPGFIKSEEYEACCRASLS
jgi:8-oxo-dGTP diphosphatase